MKKSTAVIKRLELELLEAKERLQALDEQLGDKPAVGPGEGATLAYSWEMALARKEAALEQIKTLEAAIDRAQAHTYGSCERCGEPIDPERLEILPTTTFCAACAGQQG